MLKNFSEKNLGYLKKEASSSGSSYTILGGIQGHSQSRLHA